MKLFRVMCFIMSLTLSTVVSHIALLTQALVLCTWSPIHTPNVTVLDCGKNKTKIHTHEHRPALGFSSVYPNTCCRLYLRHQQNWHWTMFLKRYASRYFLKKFMVCKQMSTPGWSAVSCKEEKMLMVDIFQSIHTPSRHLHTPVHKTHRTGR